MRNKPTHQKQSRKCFGMIHRDVIQMFEIRSVCSCWEASYGGQHFYLHACETKLAWWSISALIWPLEKSILYLNSRRIKALLLTNQSVEHLPKTHKNFWKCICKLDLRSRGFFLSFLSFFFVCLCLPFPEWVGKYCLHKHLPQDIAWCLVYLWQWLTAWRHLSVLFCNKDLVQTRQCALFCGDNHWNTV